MTLPAIGGLVGQSTVLSQFKTAIAGQIASNVPFPVVSSYQAAQPILPGLACYSITQASAPVAGEDFYAQLPNSEAIVLKAPFPLTNRTLTQITINGTLVLSTGVSENPANNLNQVASDILANATLAPLITSIQVSVIDNQLTINEATGQVLVVDSATSIPGGSTLASNWTYTASTLGYFLGVACLKQGATTIYIPQSNANVISNGQPQYLTNSPVNILQFGRIYVTPETTNSSGTTTNISNNSPVYIRTAPTTTYPVVGTFRGDSDGGTATLLPSSCAQWLVGNLNTQGGIALLNITAVQGA